MPKIVPKSIALLLVVSLVADPSLAAGTVRSQPPRVDIFSTEALNLQALFSIPLLAHFLSERSEASTLTHFTQTVHEPKPFFMGALLSGISLAVMAYRWAVWRHYQSPSKHFVDPEMPKEASLRSDPEEVDYYRKLAMLINRSIQLPLKSKRELELVEIFQTQFKQLGVLLATNEDHGQILKKKNEIREHMFEFQELHNRTVDLQNAIDERLIRIDNLIAELHWVPIHALKHIVSGYSDEQRLAFQEATERSTPTLGIGYLISNSLNRIDFVEPESIEKLLIFLDNLASLLNIRLLDLQQSYEPAGLDLFRQTSSEFEMAVRTEPPANATPLGTAEAMKRLQGKPDGERLPVWNPRDNKYIPVEVLLIRSALDAGLIQAFIQDEAVDYAWTFRNKPEKLRRELDREILPLFLAAVSSTLTLGLIRHTMASEQTMDLFPPLSLHLPIAYPIAASVLFGAFAWITNEHSSADVLLKDLHQETLKKQNALKSLDLIPEEKLDLERVLQRMQLLADTGDALSKYYPESLLLYLNELAIPLLRQTPRRLNFALASPHLEELRRLHEELTRAEGPDEAITSTDIRGLLDSAITGKKIWDDRSSSKEWDFLHYYLPGFPIIIEFGPSYDSRPIPEQDREKLAEAARLISESGWIQRYPEVMTRTEAIAITNAIEFEHRLGSATEHRHNVHLYLSDHQSPEEIAATLLHEDRHITQQNDSRFISAWTDEKAIPLSRNTHFPWTGDSKDIKLSRLLNELDSYGLEAEWSLYLANQKQDRLGHRALDHQIFANRKQAQDALTILHDNESSLNDSGKALLETLEARWAILSTAIQWQWECLLDELLSSKDFAARLDGFLFVSDAWVIDPAHRSLYAAKFRQALASETDEKILFLLATHDNEFGTVTVPPSFKRPVRTKLNHVELARAKEFLMSGPETIRLGEPLRNVMTRLKREQPPPSVVIWNYVRQQPSEMDFWNYIEAVLDGSVARVYDPKRLALAQRLSNLSPQDFDAEIVRMHDYDADQPVRPDNYRQEISEDAKTFEQAMARPFVVEAFVGSEKLTPRQQVRWAYRLNQDIRFELLTREMLRRWAAETPGAASTLYQRCVNLLEQFTHNEKLEVKAAATAFYARDMKDLSGPSAIRDLLFLQMDELIAAEKVSSFFRMSPLRAIHSELARYPEAHERLLTLAHDFHSFEKVFPNWENDSQEFSDLLKTHALLLDGIAKQIAHHPGREREAASLFEEAFQINSRMLANHQMMAFPTMRFNESFIHQMLEEAGSDRGSYTAMTQTGVALGQIVEEDAKLAPIAFVLAERIPMAKYREHAVIEIVDQLLDQSELQASIEGMDRHFKSYPIVQPDLVAFSLKRFLKYPQALKWMGEWALRIPPAPSTMEDESESLADITIGLAKAGEHTRAEQLLQTLQLRAQDEASWTREIQRKLALARVLRETDLELSNASTNALQTLQSIPKNASSFRSFDDFLSLVAEIIQEIAYTLSPEKLMEKVDAFFTAVQPTLYGRSLRPYFEALAKGYILQGLAHRGDVLDVDPRMIEHLGSDANPHLSPIRPVYEKAVFEMALQGHVEGALRLALPLFEDNPLEGLLQLIDQLHEADAPHASIVQVIHALTQIDEEWDLRQLKRIARLSPLYSGSSEAMILLMEKIVGTLSTKEKKTFWDVELVGWIAHWLRDGGQPHTRHNIPLLEIAA